ncbi:MAG: outer membrane beta-barrel protein, partial [Gammaproteobacteria bacterium]
MKFKMKPVLPLLICCLASSGSALADASDTKYHYKDVIYKDAPTPKNHDHFEVIGAGGTAKLNQGNSSFAVTSSESDTLHQTNASDWNTLAAQLGVGYVHYLHGAERYPKHIQWFPMVEPELNGYYLASNSIKGNVWRFNDSAYSQSTYDIPIHSTRLMLDAALTVMAYKKFSLYGLGGLGEAWNRISYSDSGTGSSACPDQNVSLSSNTRSSFAWELGAGLLYNFNNRIGLSLEYLYADLGTVKTAASGNTGTITSPTLSPVSFNLKTQ